MCHDIEDPTFDATAVATNPRAQVRPIHRPPRTPPTGSRTAPGRSSSTSPTPRSPASRRWTSWPNHAPPLGELDPIDPTDDGHADYSGPLLSDFDFAAFSHSALVRIADEVCLQMHLLNLSFGIAVRARAEDDTELATQIRTKQLIGIAGVAAERIQRALKLPNDIDGLRRACSSCTRC